MIMLATAKSVEMINFQCPFFLTKVVGGSGGVQTRVGSGRVGSGQEVPQISRVGSGRVGSARSGPTREV